MRSNILSHDSTIRNQPPQNARRYGNRPSSTSSLIGGIDSDDRWKTSNQLPIQTGPGRSSYKRQSVQGNESHEFGVTPIERLRKQLFERGSNGISGLSRKFKSMDDDGSRSLSISEFKKAILEYGLDFTGPEIVELFNSFDRDKSGTIDMDEFLVRVRGKLNQRRRDLVYLAFQKIDKDGNGELNLQDVMDVYDASQHPDVMSGKRKPEDVLLEFLETFDVGGEVDGKVTVSEFENYYANLSASIDDDDYFELMIRNAWHISGGEGWCANTSNRRVLVTDSSGNQRVEEIKDDLGLRAEDKSGMMARLRAQGSTSISNIDLYSGGEHGIGGKAAPPRSAPQKKGISKAFAHETTASTSYIPSTGYLSKGNEVKLNRPGSAGYQNLSRNVSSNLNGSRAPAARAPAPSVDASNLMSYNHPSLEMLRSQLKSRGANGISGLSKAFRRMDFDGSKSLSYEEFSRALSESGLRISEPDKRRLFLYFDRDRGGSVDYNEFLVGIRGSLNERRKRLVGMAFQRFDKDGNGIIDIQDVIGVYDASKHPDVISGKRTAGQILMEFIEGFDVGGEVDGKVTVSEFENYYANLSASIDDDDYFELMIRNAWHISGGEGWCANTSNRRVLVTDSSGNQRVEEIKDDLGLRAEDKSGMMARLRAQGVDVSNIDLTSGLDETSPGNAKGKPPPQVRAQAQSQSRYESQTAQPPPSSQGSRRPEPSLSSSSNRFSSSRAEVRPSSATGHGTNSGSAARAAFPGMVLPNGLIVKEIREPSSSQFHSRTSNQSRPQSAGPPPPPIPGELRDKYKDLKHSAFRLYSQKNYREAEVAYMQCLQFLLEVNGNQTGDPEYVKGVDNVNKCREKLGLRRMAIEEREELEDCEEW